MPKRSQYSRWRRLPGVYRVGERNRSEPGQELQRLTLYLTGTLLDAAEAQANRSGVGSVDEYCARLLQRGIEAEAIREHVEEVEARRGPFEGLQEIANDPEYLAEWKSNAQSSNHEPVMIFPAASEPEPEPETGPEPHTSRPAEPEFESTTPDPSREIDIEFESPGQGSEAPSTIRPALGDSAEVVLRHAGQPGGDSATFLAFLRRGEAVEVPAMAELARALETMEAEQAGATEIDRRIAYALHRLAFEGQILHNEAWPGAFDAWTVDALRAVQEAVDRILSGEDIRYYPTDSRPERLF